MFPAYVLLVSSTILANLYFALADFRRSDFVRGMSTTVGIPESWYPWLGALKTAGAGGLLVGLVGLSRLGIAAAVGLICFYTGAVFAHVRARAFAGFIFTVLMWCSATGCLLLALALVWSGSEPTLR